MSLIIAPAKADLYDIHGRLLQRMVRNPMLDYPGAWACWCDAKPRRAARKCCLPRLAKEIPACDAWIGEEYMAYVRENYGKVTHVEAKKEAM